MTDWKHHHPPPEHPDFDAYLNTLTDDDFEAINATAHRPPTQYPPPDDAPQDPY